MFKNNYYIRSVLLNELELNSVIHDEFAHGQHEPLLSLNLEMKPGKLDIETNVIFIDLFPKKIQKIVLKDQKPYTNRPNAHLEPVDFEKEFDEYYDKLQRAKEE